VENASILENQVLNLFVHAVIGSKKAFLSTAHFLVSLSRFRPIFIFAMKNASSI
jgi:hypothetical protein